MAEPRLRIIRGTVKEKGICSTCNRQLDIVAKERVKDEVTVIRSAEFPSQCFRMCDECLEELRNTVWPTE
jgi:hypothetical protein